MKRTLAILIMSVFALGLKAQHHEFGPFIGTMYYLGDLVPSKQFGDPGYNFGAMYRYEANQRFAVRIAAHYGKISGDSENNRKNLQYHNLNFFSNVVDIEMGFEINFLKYSAGSRHDRFTPFIFGGVSVFKFNPKTEYFGNIYELQPLGTEGQGTTAYPDRTPYKLTSWAIPFGAGIKLSLTKTVSIGLEWSFHKTFTDYLDDVSGQYADWALIRAESGPLAAALSNRMHEDEADMLALDISIKGNGQPKSQVDFNTYQEVFYYDNLNQYRYDGKQRGNSEDKDWYSILGLSIMFKLVGPKTPTCPAYKQHMRFKEYKIF